LILYLDTSVLVAAFTHEKSTRRVLAWLNEAEREGLAISDWVRAEFSSALSLKMRTRQIDESYRTRAKALFEAMAAGAVRSLPVSREHFGAAARFADEHRLGLRAPDALHLAIAAGNDATLVTLDKSLAKAGARLGVPTRLL
jgi:uncharacterized protein